MARIIPLLFFLSFILPVFGQSDSTRLKSFSGPTRFHLIQAGYGGIIAHNAPVKHLAQSHPRNIGYEYSWINTKDEWSESYHFPKTGLLLQYFNYQSPSILGSSISTTVFLEPTLWRNFTYRIGTGIEYNTNPFDLDKNTTNLMLGSHWALVMHGQINYVFRIGSKLGLRTGIGITHFSNGSYEVPNSGINNFYLSLAVMQMSDYKHVAHQADSFAHPVKWRKGFSASVSASFGIVEKLPVDGPKYGAYHVHARLNYRKGRKSTFLVGADYAYNNSYQQMIQEKSEFGPKEGRLGIILGHELHVSKISMITEFGYYAVKNQSINPEIYQRYGLRYYWLPNLHSALYLKVHGSKAECFEWAVGYHFIRQKKQS